MQGYSTEVKGEVVSRPLSRHVAVQQPPPDLYYRRHNASLQAPGPTLPPGGRKSEASLGTMTGRKSHLSRHCCLPNARQSYASACQLRWSSSPFSSSSSWRSIESFQLLYFPPSILHHRCGGFFFSLYLCIVRWPLMTLTPPEPSEKEVKDVDAKMTKSSQVLSAKLITGFLH